MSAERFALLVPAGERVSQHLPWDGGGLEWNVVVLEQMTIDLRVWAKLGPPGAGARDAGSRRLLLQEHRNRQSIRGMFEPSDDDRLILDQDGGPGAERAEVTEIIFDLNNTFSWLNSKKVEIVIVPTGPPPSGVPRLVVAEPSSPIPRSRAAVAGPTSATVAAPALQKHVPLDGPHGTAVGTALRETLAAQLEAWLAAVEAAERSCDGRYREDWGPLLRLVGSVRRHLSPEQPAADADAQAGGQPPREQLEGHSADGVATGRELDTDDNRQTIMDAPRKSFESPPVLPEVGGTENAAEPPLAFELEVSDTVQAEPTAALDATVLGKLRVDAPVDQGSFESPTVLPEVGDTEDAAELAPPVESKVSDAALAKRSTALDVEVSDDLQGGAPVDQGSFESPRVFPEIAGAEDAAEPAPALDLEVSVAARAEPLATLDAEVSDELQESREALSESGEHYGASGDAAAAGTASYLSKEDDASSGDKHAAALEESREALSESGEHYGASGDAAAAGTASYLSKEDDASSGDKHAAALEELALGADDLVDVEQDSLPGLPPAPADLDAEINGAVERDPQGDAETMKDVGVEVEVAAAIVAEDIPPPHYTDEGDEHRPGQLMVDPWDEDDEDEQLQLHKEHEAEDEEEEEEDEEPFLTPSSKGASTKGKAD